MLRFLAASVLAVSPCLAAKIFVGGHGGSVVSGDSAAGGFEFFSLCGGPINSMAIFDNELFLGDTLGRIYKSSLDTGAITGFFDLKSDARAMMVHDGVLLVADSSGEILKVDPVSGDVVGQLTSPTGVLSMTVAGGQLYVAGPDGDVYRGNPDTGEFSYFVCACFSSSSVLASDETHLVIGDSAQFGARVNLLTANFDAFFFLPASPTAILLDGDVLLMTEESGNIHRVDSWTGEVFGQMTTRIDSRAMTTLPPPQCAGDFSGNGAFDLTDLGVLLGAFGLSDAGDIDGDGATDLGDLGALLAVFGTECP